MRRILLLTILLSGTAAAQAFDPDPSHPGAQDFAQRQYIMSLVGFTPAPIGWVCRLDSTPIDSWWTAECHPDPAVLAEQEAERKRFYEELRKRAERIRRRR